MRLVCEWTPPHTAVRALNNVYGRKSRMCTGRDCLFWFILGNGPTIIFKKWFGGYQTRGLQYVLSNRNTPELSESFSGKGLGRSRVVFQEVLHHSCEERGIHSIASSDTLLWNHKRYVAVYCLLPPFCSRCSVPPLIPPGYLHPLPRARLWSTPDLGAKTAPQQFYSTRTDTSPLAISCPSASWSPPCKYLCLARSRRF